MVGKRSRETAVHASAVGMQAYRDGSGRLWISLPDDRIPAELLSVATALLDYAPKVPANQEQHPSGQENRSLLLRVLSWIDRAGVSVRDILQSVRDETGPDEASILAIEVALAQLRPAAPVVESEAASLAPTSGGQSEPELDEPAKAVAQAENDFFPTPPWASAPIMPATMMPDYPWSPSSTTSIGSRGESHPTPQWLANLLSKPTDSAPDDGAPIETELDQVTAANGNEVEALLERLAEQTHLPPKHGSEPDNFARNFEHLIKQIERAVEDVRRSVQNEQITELAPVERLLTRVRECGIEAYIKQERATAESISLIGESVLSRLAALSSLYGRREAIRA